MSITADATDRQARTATEIGTGTAPTVTTALRFLKGAVPAAGGRVPALLRIRADAPFQNRRRSAIDLALVLDRSGSMRGEPLLAAKAAALDAIDLMEEGDRISLVTFDNTVEVVFPPSSVTDRRPLYRAVEGIETRGTTSLHAGWVEGTQQLVNLLDDDRSARALLLTDGQANVGVTDPLLIAQDVAKLGEVGVTTSTVGLGRGFQEDLLSMVAEAGGGRFAYAETPSDLEGVIAADLIAADATAGRDVRARLEVTGDRATDVRAIGAYPEEDGTTVLPDLLLGMPLDVPLEIDLKGGDDAPDVTLGSVTLTWTDGAGETVEASVPIVADAVQDTDYAAREDDPDVVIAHALATAARLYDEAMQALDRRDLPRVESHLKNLDATLNAAPDDARVDRQRARLDQARVALRDRDPVLTRKRFHASREAYRFEGAAMSASAYGNEKLMALKRRRSERRTWDGDAGRPDLGHALGTPTPVATYDIPRADGSHATLRVLEGDITRVPAEALINPSNTRLHGSGRTVDGAVHRVGGRELTRDCRAIGRIDLAHAAVTKGHRLPVDYVIHVAVPTFHGLQQDWELLEKSYRAAFAMARQMRIGHLTVPAIGMGANGFPLDRGAKHAVELLTREAQAEGSPNRIDVVLMDDHVRYAYLRVLDASILTPAAGQ